MLVGEKEDALPALKCPFEGSASVGRGAYQASAFAAEGFDGGCRVHVGQGNQFIREAEFFERLPGGFDLRYFGHVGHGAASVEIGQDDLLDGVAVLVLAA